MTLDEARKAVAVWGYQITDRASFLTAANLFKKSGLPHDLQIASTVQAKARAMRFEGEWVIHDPLSDEDGWMIVFNSDEFDSIVAQTFEQAL